MAISGSKPAESQNNAVPITASQVGACSMAFETTVANEASATGTECTVTEDSTVEDSGGRAAAGRTACAAEIHRVAHASTGGSGTVAGETSRIEVSSARTAATSVACGVEATGRNGSNKTVAG